MEHQVNDLEKNRTEAHNNHFKPAKVFPRSARFMKINNELTETLINANRNINQTLEANWIAYYCDQGLGDQEGENVLRCGKAQTDHSYVNSWFIQRFGVDYKKMSELYGL